MRPSALSFLFALIISRFISLVRWFDSLYLLLFFSSHPHHRKSTLNVAYPSIYSEFLTRFNDIEPSVRLAMVQFARQMLSSHPEAAAQLTELLSQRVLDPDEKVWVEFAFAALLECFAGLRGCSRCYLRCYL